MARWAGVRGCRSTVRPGRAAEIKIGLSCPHKGLPPWSLICGNRSWISQMNCHACHLVSSHRRWEWVSTLKNQCKNQ